MEAVIFVWHNEFEWHNGAIKIWSPILGHSLFSAVCFHFKVSAEAIVRGLAYALLDLQ